MATTKFNDDALTRARDGLNLFAANVLITKYSPGETLYTPWTNFIACFENIGINAKGSPVFNEEAILEESDYETRIRGFNISGEITTKVLNQELIDFLDVTLRNQAVSILIIPNDASVGDLSLYIENVRLTGAVEGKANDDGSPNLKLTYKKRTKQIGDVYRILTVEDDVLTRYPIYGVKWDAVNDTYERLGTLSPFADTYTVPESALPIQRQMKRCVVEDDGTVAYYLDEDDSTLKADGSASVLDGTDGQIMVEIPEFYYKNYVEGDDYYFWITESPLPGFTKMPRQYVGAYGAYNDFGTLASISGVLPTSDQKRATFRAQAENRGSNWCLFDWQAWFAAAMLYLVEYASFNSQAEIGEGNTDFATWDYATCISNTGKSNDDGNNSNNKTSVGGDSGDYMSYRGIEDLYGNLWQFIDGINIKNIEGDGSYAFIATDPLDYADNVETGYEDTGKIAEEDEYGATPNIQNLIANSVGANSSTGMCDFFYTYFDNLSVGFGVDWRVVLVGGRAHYGSRAGVFCVYAGGDSSNSGSNVGARLCLKS